MHGAHEIITCTKGNHNNNSNHNDNNNYNNKNNNKTCIIYEKIIISGMKKASLCYIRPKGEDPRQRQDLEQQESLDNANN